MKEEQCKAPIHKEGRRCGQCERIKIQKSCDHVIKISAGGSEFCDLSRIHISGKETDCGDSGYQGSVIYYPVCCPECGEKLNLKKDEEL